jgi:hypothetical protein
MDHQITQIDGSQLMLDMANLLKIEQNIIFKNGGMSMYNILTCNCNLFIYIQK